VATRTTLRDTLISTGFPFRPGDQFKTYMAMLADVMPLCAGVRRPGSAALDLAYVAAGFSDGFFEMGLSPWDVAAGSLLVTEAGGLVGNFTGESDFLEQRECMAASPRIYGQLVPLLGKYSQFAGPGEIAGLPQAGAQTAPDVPRTSMQLAKTLKKIAVVSGVCDGFIGNRIVARYGAAANDLINQGALPQQVDAALQKFGFAMGPFRIGRPAWSRIGSSTAQPCR